ncbi:hypothetical protein CVT26_013388 [Gymnopilus dilepis]|uniref:Uncharacterized protein n=1 Tax=Gymnopilus dilepis TaxID=231916 RepID=A0A409WDH1_9AGAR|nr:hypothetical protein CVT26_013388 [Gymnopilus dilepis]
MFTSLALATGYLKLSNALTDTQGFVSLRGRLAVLRDAPIHANESDSGSMTNILLDGQVTLVPFISPGVKFPGKELEKHPGYSIVTTGHSRWLNCSARRRYAATELQGYPQARHVSLSKQLVTLGTATAASANVNVVPLSNPPSNPPPQAENVTPLVVQSPAVAPLPQVDNVAAPGLPVIQPAEVALPSPEGSTAQSRPPAVEVKWIVVSTSSELAKYIPASTCVADFLDTMEKNPHHFLGRPSEGLSALVLAVENADPDSRKTKPTRAGVIVSSLPIVTRKAVDRTSADSKSAPQDSNTLLQVGDVSQTQDFALATAADPQFASSEFKAPQSTDIEKLISSEKFGVAVASGKRTPKKDEYRQAIIGSPLSVSENGYTELQALSLVVRQYFDIWAARFLFH